MPSDVLVSLCNTGKRQATKLIRVARSGEITPIDLPSTQAVRGATSCIPYGDGFLLSIQTSPATVVELDSAFNEVGAHQIPFAADVHGLAVSPEGVLAVSTGHNAVVLLDDHFRIVRTVGALPGAGNNVDHVNDICRANDRTVISSLGPRRASGLRNGSVRDLETGEVLFDGLNEPHSVTFHDGRIHVLDSATGTLFRFEPGLGLQKLVAIVGYARGLAFKDDTIFIGRSSHRTEGRTSSFQHPSRLIANAREGRDGLTPGVFFYSPLSGESDFVSVSAYGSEIYQIAAL